MRRFFLSHQQAAKAQTNLPILRDSSRLHKVLKPRNVQTKNKTSSPARYVRMGVQRRFFHMCHKYQNLACCFIKYYDLCKALKKANAKIKYYKALFTNRYNFNLWNYYMYMPFFNFIYMLFGIWYMGKAVAQW